MENLVNIKNRRRIKKFNNPLHVMSRNKYNQETSHNLQVLSINQNTNEKIIY